MTWYLEIRADASYRGFMHTSAMVDFLRTMPELRQTGPMRFDSAGKTWCIVALLHCDDAGCYSSTGTFLPAINLVELFCSYHGNPLWYRRLAGRIARFARWSIYDQSRDG
jgi:hypothetical protein